MKQKPEAGGAAEGLFAAARTFFACVFAVFTVYALFFRVAGVDGNSMEPNLHSGENVLVTTCLSLPDYGEIVAISRNGAERSIVKRVIARGGDTVDINFATHLITVNGRVIPENYRVLGAVDVQGDLSFPLQVPENCVFVLGDNRNDSLDSRFAEIGCIRFEEILGRVRCRIFPFAAIE